METNLYEQLGVAREATPDQIRKAYRKRAKKSHPDGGGDAEAFVELRRAVAVLSDPERRRRYDETGATDETVIDDASQRAMSLLAAMLSSIIDQTDDAARYDVVRVIADQLGVNLATLNDAVAQLDRKIWSASKTRDRTRARGKDKRFLSVAEGVIRKLKRSRESAVAERDSTKLALEMLRDCEFDVDESFQPFGGDRFATATF